MASLPAHLNLAIANIGKLSDGPDVVRLAGELGKAYPQFAGYYREAGPGTAWCGIFCAWCLTKSGVEVGGPRNGVGPMYVNWWLNYGTEVPVHQRQPGDLALWLGNPSPHHIAMVGDQEDYIGGNQADTVCRRHFRTPDAVRRPPAPGKKPTAGWKTPSCRPIRCRPSGSSWPIRGPAAIWNSTVANCSRIRRR